MKKIIMLLAAGAMAFGFAACSDDDTVPTGNITTADQLYLPRNNAAISLETGNTTHFEWAVSKAGGNGYVTYELLFDKEDGNFSNPIYGLISDNNGYEPSAKVESSTLNTIAVLAGADLGETATVKWTVRARCGLVSELYGTAAGVRTVSIIRVNSVDPMPAEVRLAGEVTEEQSDVVLFAACPVASVKSGANNDREQGAYECFTKLKPGKLTVVDDLERNFKLGARNKMELIKDGEADKSAMTIDKEGIYWVYLNFNTMSYKIKEIEKVEVWTSPWWDGNLTALEPLKYDGNGVWSVTDYAWVIGVVAEGRIDSRYHFVCTYTDGSQERWSHIEDDCRSANNPDSKANFYNVYRFTKSISGVDEWGHSWKTREDLKEGLGKKVTFHVYMNNTKNGYFIHDRSFSDSGEEGGGDEIPTEVKISGAATEAQATIALSAASILHTSKGGEFNDDREAGAFEAYTKLTANTLTIVDNNGVNYSLADNGDIVKASGANATTIKEEGIYRLYLNFNAMKYTMQKISKVEFWRINGGDKAELTYDGNGVWSITDYAWSVKEGSGDSRYKFICSFADGTVEHWGHREDDCRQSGFAEPGQGGGATEKGPLFYNVFRLSTGIGEWEHTWKVNEDAKEGFGKLVTFHVYMNNTKDKLFLHDRSFK